MIIRYLNAKTQRRWTPTAIDCFERGCVCEGCFYNTFFEDSVFQCRMKGAVIELVRKLGAPNGVKAKTTIGGEDE